MRKRPVSIAILLLVLGFVLLYYTMQKQYMEFQNTCNQKMEELRNTALLWESNGLLEDSFVSGTFCAESGTASGPDVSGEGVPLDPDGVPVYG